MELFYAEHRPHGWQTASKSDTLIIFSDSQERDEWIEEHLICGHALTYNQARDIYGLPLTMYKRRRSEQ